MEDKYFKTDAKQIVDMLFDTKVFKDDMTRDDFNNLEDFVGYLLQSKFDSYVKVTKLMDSINSVKQNHK